MNKHELAQMIDHTLLKADATFEQIEVLCREAIEYNFKTICINPYHISSAKNLLKNSSIGICTVVGFPLGANQTATKVFETKESIKAAATEIDMVINIGALKAKKLDFVQNDIEEVVKAAGDICVKIIIETALLTNEEKIIACELAKTAKASFVKTSTGFSSSGATPADITLMKEAVEGKLQVKASAGIRNYEDAISMIKSGADRLGTSASVQIINSAP